MKPLPLLQEMEVGACDRQPPWHKGWCVYVWDFFTYLRTAASMYDVTCLWWVRVYIYIYIYMYIHIAFRYMLVES